jgi:hypothetical protein
LKLSLVIFVIPGANIRLKLENIFPPPPPAAVVVFLLCSSDGLGILSSPFADENEPRSSSIVSDL